MSDEKLLTHGKEVAEYFEATAPFWEDVYDLNGRFYRQRHERALHFIDKLGLPVASRLLEVGCGPGLTSVELARRGYFVDAVDIAPAMIERTVRRALAAGVGGRICARQADIRSLTFPGGTFDSVLALGVIPWVFTPREALAQMLHVLRPGGFLIVTTDNLWALHHILDPVLNPLAMPFKRAAQLALAHFGCRVPVPLNRLDCTWKVDRWLREAGFQKLDSSTLGFGPFSLFKRALLPRNVETRVRRLLQQQADSGVPILRSMGHVYIVLCRKP